VLLSIFLSLLPQGGSYPGDTTIPGASTSPITDPNKTLAVAVGMGALSSMSSSTAQGLLSAQQNGTVVIVELHSTALDGMTDGNTIAISLDDNPSADQIAERLFH